MDIIFVRIDEKTFQLIPTRSCSTSEPRLIKRHVEHLLYEYLRDRRFLDDKGRESIQFEGKYYWDPAEEIINCITKRHLEYKFWELITVPTKKFQYESIDGPFKSIMEKNRLGTTMDIAISEIKELLGWKEFPQQDK